MIKPYFVMFENRCSVHYYSSCTGGRFDWQRGPNIYY
jgi:hypothetical protein